MKKILLVCLKFLLCAGYLFAQDRVITGKVTDSGDHTPLPGVNILIKGTNRGTSTDSNGKFQLSVPNETQTLVFSFIGFVTKEVSIGNNSAIDVALDSDVHSLQEVVIGALGIQRQSKELGYSVGKVKSDELNQAKALNAATALSGKVAGLQVNTINNGVNPSTRIVLRGNRSLVGDNQALVVIDGVQVPQDAINYLNPNDIESINVLKGANAAALYGSSASNGALIITTKRGATPEPRITFTNTSSLESISFMPKFNDRFGGGTENYSRIFVPFENQSYGPEYTTGPVESSVDGAVEGTLIPVGRELEDGTRQKIPYLPLKDERRKAFDVGRTTQNDFSIQVGDKSGGFFFSLQDVVTKGVLPGDEYRRTGGRFNADRTYKGLKAGFNLAYSQVATNTTNSNFYNNILNTPSYIPISTYRNWRDYKNADGSLNYANPNNYYNDYFDNPYFSKDINRNSNRVGYLTGGFDLSYQATSWLSFAYRAGLTYNTYSGKNWSEKFTYTDFAKASGKYNAKDLAGSAGDYSAYESQINTDFLITMKKNIGVFSGTLILGNNIRQKTSKYVNAGISSLVISGLYNLNNLTGQPTAGESNFTSRLLGFYGDFTLGYRDFLFVHASAREDVTSVLAPENRSYFYPGVDVSLVLSDMIPAIKNSNTITYAKLTAAATKVGGVNVGPYELQTVFNTSGGFPYGSLPGFTYGNTIKDPLLKPEFTTSYEVGGELGLFNNRVNLELAYYSQKTTNQTVSIDISGTTGFSRATINTGAMLNRGYEVTLKGTPVNTSYGLKWDVNLNYSYIDNKILSLYEGLDEINLSSYYGVVNSSLYQVFARVGEQYPIMKVVAYKRDPQGRVIVDANTGYPVKDPNLKSMGQTNPKHRLGLSTTVKYKGLALSALAEYRGGNVVAHGLAETMWFTGLAGPTTNYGRERFIFPNSVYQSGSNADGTPVYVENKDVALKDGGLGAWDSNLRNIGENFVTSGAFWKLREVSLSYDLPTALLSKTKVLKTAKISLVGRNLLTLLPKANVYTDPEFNNTTTNAVGVNATYITPPTRTYGFSVSVGL
ncbi:SusC/RagA family TonB-linked outer membrane protein [Xanthocytophaga agilis]|uniref:SusC/RagA family TonB-linked outer membrane protein n=1 Tax=Xanthocytophaga agilis TaxID=3048010 RepID=A0AAE3UGS2_9BACT|nr:SusC/RagA family TonB-linked outer membrane protein [Xanthocytophaga agilis]MDJ1501903.1 SusC/RagA family TonB-linked outer membrane protein [Xanthocytophaga agilis]